MTKPGAILKYLPTIGILTFVGLYFYAAQLYPGGSQADANSVGFDWSNNYWCNLMREQGLNGAENPARPVAIAAIVLLCISMTLFFFQFANRLIKNRNWKLALKISGAAGMLSAVFIFTPLHDIMITILSICGTVVLIAMIRALYQHKLNGYMAVGILGMLLVGLNNFFYYNPNLIVYSPLVQKTAFVVILGWTIVLNIKMNKLRPSST